MEHYISSVNHQMAEFPIEENGEAKKNSTLQDDNNLYDVPTGIIVLLSIGYGSISLVAVVGNFCVLWIVATSRRMQTVTNFFIANLACADIIIGLFSIPFQFQAALLQRWVLPNFMCAFCPFVQVLSVNVSIFTLTAIALDRYRAVMSPLKARTSKLRAKVAVLGIWAFSAALGAPNAVALRVSIKNDPATGNKTKPFCQNSEIPPLAWRTYNHILVSLQYFVPLFIISYAYLRMGIRLRENQTPGNAQGPRDANILRNKQKVSQNGLKR
ncbi:RYamide receptor-like [Tachypleus tridentatus]|uniref:RYamide receptor-like n=1 Tax=Tachypleus tridentatus TaxID=6853 RepID=UPI003FD25805